MEKNIKNLVKQAHFFSTHSIVPPIFTVSWYMIPDAIHHQQEKNRKHFFINKI